MTNEQAQDSARLAVHRQPGDRQRGDNRPILILGSSGPLGRALLKALRPLGTIVAACREPDRESLLPIPVKVDMSRPASLREAIRVLRPSLIVNAAAIGDVDAAEAEPRRAQQVNANAPAILAEEALLINAGIVHFCSDMVFNGLGERPFRENDLPCPLNLQARTRLVGTKAICTSGAKHLVLRSGWLYSSWSDNYVKRIVELVAYRNSLTLPADYCGCPTSIDWLAETLARILSQANGDYTGWLEKCGGLYHLSMLGYASRVEVADQVVAICKAHGVPLTINGVRGVPLSELPSVAKIPANCKLDPTKIATTFGLQLPRWQDEMRIQVSRMLSESVAAEQVA